MAKVRRVGRRSSILIFLFMAGLIGPIWTAVYLVPGGGTGLVRLVKADYADLAGWNLDELGDAIPAHRKS